MTEALGFLWPSFVVAVCLVGIHAYFGIQVLARNVIFVDLALAQIAALGATVAFMLGHPAQSRRAMELRRSLVAQEVPGNHDPLDLAGALIDLGDLCVAHHAFDREVDGLAGAAEQLHGVGGDLHRRVRCEELRDGCEVTDVLALVVDEL